MVTWRNDPLGQVKFRRVASVKLYTNVGSFSHRADAPVSVSAAVKEHVNLAAAVSDMEVHSELRSTTQVCFDRTSSALTVDDVYEIAKLVGTEVEKLIDGYGKESVEALVPKIVKVLELLESFASRNQALKLREEELLKTFETLQLQQQKKRGAKDSEEVHDKSEIRVRRGCFQSCHHFVNTIQSAVTPLQLVFARCNTVTTMFQL